MIVHRWNTEIVGRGRWWRRINLAMDMVGQQQLAAVVLHLMAEETGGGVISTSRMRKVWRCLDAPLIPFMTPSSPN
jgi:hypothetical protein